MYDHILSILSGLHSNPYYAVDLVVIEQKQFGFLFNPV